MAAKALNNVKLTDTLTISECQDGFWFSMSKNENGGMFSKYKKENNKFILSLVKPEWYDTFN